MSWWMQKYSGVQDVAGTTGVIAVCYADTEADIGTRTDFSGFTLLASSTCHVIDDGSDWMLDTAGTWHKQPDQHTTQLDLSGYYTAAEVETAIADALRAFIVGDVVTANYDLNNFVTVGHMNCPATIANSCQNRPLGMNQTGGFGVTNTLIYSAEGTADKVRQDLIYNVTGNNLAKNRAFWRVYSSAGWSPWFEDDKTEVVL